jgi:hypothetical protein
MLKKLRATRCPLCGNELGAMIDQRWVPMPLDEYREHAERELTTARLRPDTCVACGTPKSPPLAQAAIA